MANAIFNNFKKEICKINWEDNSNITIKVMLMDSSYTPDIDLHLNKADIDNIDNAEVTGTGYTAGGADLVNRSITVDNTTDFSKFDGDDITWSDSTITARGAIVYLDSGDANTSTLISYVDFVSDKSSDAGDFLIQWSSDGVLKVG